MAFESRILRLLSPLAAIVALSAAGIASAQDVDLSGIAREDVKKDATSNSWAPSLSGGSTPAVAQGTSSWTPKLSWLDPLGLMSGGEEAATADPPRRSGTGTVRTTNGSSLYTQPTIETKGGAWWDPLGLIYPAEETVVYEDVNGFLNQPRLGP